MTVTIELENKYCNIYGPYIEKAENYAEISESLMDFVYIYDKGCRCYIGTTKPNVNSQRYFEAKGFICTDDTVQTRLYPCDIKEVVGPYHVVTLSEDDYDLYRLFHTKYFSDYAWTAERIYKAMERWDVSIVKIDGEIVANTFTCGGEVFGGMVLPQYENTELMAQLYYENSAAHFKRGFKEIVWFMPEGYQLEDAKRVGYEAYDTYLCYEHNSF